MMARQSDARQSDARQSDESRRDSAYDYEEQREQNYVVPSGEELKDKKQRDKRLLDEAILDHETLDHELVDPDLLSPEQVDAQLEEALNVASLPVEEVSLEELEELDDADPYDTNRGDLFDTAHTDGSTNNPDIAWQQGLVYTPPDDPPVVPSDDLQNVEIAAGFGQSIEESSPVDENFPERVENNDSDLEHRVREALRYNSETTTLDNLHVRVRDGVVMIGGTVEFDDDISLIDSVVRFIDGVVDVRYRIRREDEVGDDEREEFAAIDDDDDFDDEELEGFGDPFFDITDDDDELDDDDLDDDDLDDDDLENELDDEESDIEEFKREVTEAELFDDDAYDAEMVGNNRSRSTRVGGMRTDGDLADEDLDKDEGRTR
jgi:hypothetical protein